MLRNFYSDISQNSFEVINVEQQSKIIEDLTGKIESKRQEVEHLQNRLHHQQGTTVSKQVVLRLEARISELQSNMDVEATCRKKAEVS